MFCIAARAFICLYGRQTVLVLCKTYSCKSGAPDVFFLLKPVLKAKVVHHLWNDYLIGDRVPDDVLYIEDSNA